MGGNILPHLHFSPTVLPMFLLLGSSGYVGSAFRRHFDESGLPYACLSLKDSTTRSGVASTSAILGSRSRISGCSTI